MLRLIVILFISFGVLVSNGLGEDRVIQSATKFIGKSQHPDGSFLTYRCLQDGRCLHDYNVFTTAMILYSLSGISGFSQVEDIYQRGLNFLIKGKKEGDLWSFWADKRLGPDVDDTSLVSFVLKKRGIKPSNLQTIRKNTNSEGLFYTWIREPGLKNDVDSVVNANVILYLGDGVNTEKSCRWLNSLIEDNKEYGSYYYYQHITDLYYAITRAYKEGARCLEPAVKVIKDRILKMLHTDGSINGNVQHTILAGLSLVNSGYRGKEVDLIVSFVRSRQRKDGSFEASHLFSGSEPPDKPKVFWKGDVVTTALAVELITSLYASSLTTTK